MVSHIGRSVLVILAAVVVGMLCFQMFFREVEQPSRGGFEEQPGTPTSGAEAGVTTGERSARDQIDVGEATLEERSVHVGRDVSSILRLAAHPTPESIQQMLNALFALPDSWQVIDGLLLDLRAGRLSASDRNAAMLAIEAAVQLFHDAEFTALHGDEHGARLTASLLRSLSVLDESMTNRLVQILGNLRTLDARHVAALETLLATDPLPAGATAILKDWSTHLGADAAYLMLAMTTHQDPAIRAAAIGYLMRFDPQVYLEEALHVIANTNDPAEKRAFLQAIVAGLGAELGMPVLREQAREDLAGDPFGSFPLYLSLFRNLVEGRTDTFIMDQIAAEPDPNVQGMLITTLGPEHQNMLVRVVEGSGPPALRSRAVLRLSSQKSDPWTAEQTRQLLRSDNDRVFRDGLTAAYNVALLGKKSSWLSPLKADLIHLSRDSARPDWARRQAVEALLPLIDSSEKATLLGPDAPESLQQLLEEGLP